jgi:hypothetical protein
MVRCSLIFQDRFDFESIGVDNKNLTAQGGFLMCPAGEILHSGSPLVCGVRGS